jgi:CheY-like chemotaxis protein
MSSKLQHVLVVDDDPIIRDMVVDILDFEGYTAKTARNGRDALGILQGKENYLVLLDLMMPVMGGHEFCQRLNAMPHLRQRHIIVLMSAMDKLEEAESIHPDAIMPKPFVVDDVLRIIKPFLE